MKKLFFAALASLAMIAPAQAATIDGTGSVGLLGVTNAAPGLNVGDTLTIAFTFWSDGTDDLAVIPIATVMSTNPVTVGLGNVVTFTSAFGNFSGVITFVNATGPASNRVLDFYALGNFTPLGVLIGYDPGPMSLTFSATQTGGPTSAISASYTIASPPAHIPEPASLSLLGLGLVGLGFARRRING